MSNNFEYQKEYKLFQTLINKKFDNDDWLKFCEKYKITLPRETSDSMFKEVWEIFTKSIDLDKDKKNKLEDEMCLDFYHYLNDCLDTWRHTKSIKGIALSNIGGGKLDMEFTESSEEFDYEDNYLGDGKWKITPEEHHRKLPLSEEDIATYYELLDSIFKKRNWDKVFTEKEVEENYEYSKDVMTMNEWRVSQKDNFEKQLRWNYDEYLRKHASVYKLTSQYKRQCMHITSWSNDEDDIYVEVIEDYRWMEFCMIVGYEFPKRSIRKGKIKVTGWDGWRLPTWVNKRGKVVIEKANLEGDSEYRVQAFDKKGNHDEERIEEVIEEFNENLWDMEGEGWRTIGSRIHIAGDTEMDIEVVKLKDEDYY